MGSEIELLGNIKRQKAPEDLREKVLKRISDQVSPFSIWAVAASLVILIAAQFFFLSSSQTEKESASYSQYELIIDDHQLYHVE
jgi:type VI protein secretion system component VasF